MKVILLLLVLGLVGCKTITEEEFQNYREVRDVKFNSVKFSDEKKKELAEAGVAFYQPEERDSPSANIALDIEIHRKDFDLFDKTDRKQSCESDVKYKYHGRGFDQDWCGTTGPAGDLTASQWRKCERSSRRDAKDDAKRVGAVMTLQLYLALQAGVECRGNCKKQVRYPSHVINPPATFHRFASDYTIGEVGIVEHFVRTYYPVYAWSRVRCIRSE